MTGSPPPPRKKWWYYREEVVTPRNLWQHEMAIKRARRVREREEQERKKALQWRKNQQRLLSPNGQRWQLNEYLAQKKEELQEVNAHAWMMRRAESERLVPLHSSAESERLVPLLSSALSCCTVADA